MKNLLKAILLTTTSIIILPSSAEAAPVAAILSAAFATGGFAGMAFSSVFGLGWFGSFLVRAALGLALNALTPKPKVQGANRGYRVTTRGSALDHQVIYGRVRIGGVVVYDHTTGTNNKYLHRVIAFAGHEIESYDEVYINDEVVTLDANGYVTSPSQYAGTLIRIKEHYGTDDQTADSDLVSESGGNWTTNHRLRGIAYLYVRLAFNADKFPNGVPDITATIKGKKVYDPRTSTTAWSDNPALCIRDYLTSSYGVNEGDAYIDDTLVQAAANVCDETNTLDGSTRYTCNGAFITSSTPYDIAPDLLTSMGGTLWYAQGKWRMKAAAWSTPALALTEDDLRSNIQIQTRHSRRDNFNTVRGTFRGEESNWQVTDYTEVTNASSPSSLVTGATYAISSVGTTDFTLVGAASNTVGEVFIATGTTVGDGVADAYLGADGGQESVVDFDLPFTDTFGESRRLARIFLERNRQQLTISANFGLRALAVQIGDNVTLTNTRMGWTNKEFEVTSWTFQIVDNLEIQVQMTLRETAESIYDEYDDGAIYETDNTDLLSPFDVPQPTLDAAVATTDINDDGTTVTQINFSWDVSNDELVDYYDFQWKLSADSQYKSINLDGKEFTLSPAVSGAAYDYRVRAVNTFGVKSAFTSSVSPISTGDDGTIPNAPTSVSVSAGYGSATVTWAAPTTNTDASTLKDLFQYRVYRGNSTNPTTLVGRVSGEIFTDSGLADSTEYFYRVKAVDFTGNESAYSTNGSATTNPQLVDGADGASVLVVYADDASGTNQSLTAGSYQYVQYYEYTGSTPSLPVTGTFVKFVGDDGTTGQGIYPIYADDASGANQSFSPTGKTYVTFYEATSAPTLPVSGQTWVKYVGDNGLDGADGLDGAAGPRGAGRWNIGVTTLPTTSSGADTDFTNAIGDPVDLDQAWFYTGTLANPTAQSVWIYDEGTDTWNEQEEVIDGDLLVAGTVTADKLVANSVSALGLTIGSLSNNPTGERIEITDDVIKVYDASNTLRVQIGDLTA